MSGCSSMKALKFVIETASPVYVGSDRKTPPTSSTGALEPLEAERRCAAGPVDVEDLDLEFLADLDDFRGVRDAAARHVGDVEQPSTPPRSMNAPKSVMFLTTPFRTWSFWSSFMSFSRLPARSVSRITRRDTTMLRLALVELDDLELELLAEQLVDVGHATERDLRSRQERVDAHQVDHHAALDLLDQGAFSRLVGLVGHAVALPTRA